MLETARLLALAVTTHLTAWPGRSGITVRYDRDPWVESPEKDLVQARCDVGTAGTTSVRTSRLSFSAEQRVFIILRQFMAEPTDAREIELIQWHSAAMQSLCDRREAFTLTGSTRKAALQRIDTNQNLQHRRDKRVLSFYGEAVFTVSK